MTRPVDGLESPFASGRSADLYLLDDGRVLRRRRGGPISAHELAAMRFAVAHGVPAPRVHSVDGSDMVMDRVVGDDLLSVAARRPWRIGRIGHLLADLHLRLRTAPIGDLADVDAQTFVQLAPVQVLVHGDLHPGNVLLTADGPVVIDWEGAFLGPADADAALLWMLTEIAEVDDLPRLVRPIAGRLRRRLVRVFLAEVGRPAPTTVDLVCDVRLADRHTRPAERLRIAEFRRLNGTGGGAPGRP